MNRIPTLDGWRGIAIGLVLFDHVQESLMHGFFRPWTETGQHGVTIFFVLSGYLITLKLVESPIDLKRFYTRRFFRLMPAAWTYLAALVLLDLGSGAHHITLAGLSASLFFYRNFGGNSGDGGITLHFWSLSLEEQFYLIWPCILLLAGARRCRWIAAAGALACAGYRWLFWAHYNQSLLNLQSQVRADALLVGCLMALLLTEPKIHSAAKRWSKVWALPALATLLYCMARYDRLVPLYECVCIAGLIAATTLHAESVLSYPFSFAPLIWLGTVSYSVYIWQELFMAFRNVWLLCFGLPLFALASYYWIERPFTRLGHRLTRESNVYAEKASA